MKAMTAMFTTRLATRSRMRLTPGSPAALTIVVNASVPICDTPTIVRPSTARPRLTGIASRSSIGISQMSSCATWNPTNAFVADHSAVSRPTISTQTLPWSDVGSSASCWPSTGMLPRAPPTMRCWRSWSFCRTKPRMVVATSSSGKIDRKKKNDSSEALRPDWWRRQPSSMSTTTSMATCRRRSAITRSPVCQAIRPPPGSSRSASGRGRSSASLARLNGRLPKNPLWADSGDGCADSMIVCRDVVDQRLLAARRRAPQDEHDVLGLVVDRADDLVGERLPPSALVGRGLPGAHGQRGVEQQHALACPGLEVAVCRDGSAEVARQLLVDVDQRRRDRAPRAGPRSTARAPAPGRGTDPGRGSSPWCRRTA